MRRLSLLSPRRHCLQRNSCSDVVHGDNTNSLYLPYSLKYDSPIHHTTQSFLVVRSLRRSYSSNNGNSSADSRNSGRHRIHQVVTSPQSTPTPIAITQQQHGKFNQLSYLEGKYDSKQELYPIVTKMLSNKALKSEDFRTLFDFCRQQELLLNFEIASKFLIVACRRKKQVFSFIFTNLLKNIEGLYLAACGSEFDPLELVYPVILHYMKEGRFDRVELFYEHLRKMNVKFTDFQLNFMVTRAIRQKELQFSDRIMLDMKERGEKFTKQMTQFILGSYVNISAFDRAMEVFRGLTQDGNTMAFPFYSVLLDELKKNCHSHPEYLQYIEEVLIHLDNKTIPNANTRFFNSVLCAAGEVGNVSVAEKWFDKFIHSGLDLDHRAANGLLQAISKSELFDMGLYFVQNMKIKYGIAPNIYSFALLLDCCKNETQIATVLTEMNMQSVPLTYVFYMSVIRSMCCNKKKDIALQFYELLKLQNKSEMKPDAATIQTLVIAFYHNEQVVDSLYRDCKSLHIRPPKYLVILFTEYSPEFRDTLIQQVMHQSKESIIELHQENKDLFPALLYILEQDQDQRFDNLKTRLTDFGIHDIAPKLPMKYRMEDESKRFSQISKGKGQ